MLKDNDSDNFRTDALDRLKVEVEDTANKCSIEIRLVGGLLKFTPRGVYTRVLLVLEQASFRDVVVINLHRTSKLTSEHKGKIISANWVLGFLEQNSSEAKEAIRKEESRQQEAEKFKADLARARPIRSRSSRLKCKECNGAGKWQVGDPSYGDTHFEYCSSCHGAGYVDA